MEFNPNNSIVKRCLEGIGLAEKGDTRKAYDVFVEAWMEATSDQEKFLTAFFVSRHIEDISEKIHWLTTSLQIAAKIDDDSVRSALSSIYLTLGDCYGQINEPGYAKKYHDLAQSVSHQPEDTGPFYHGTKVDLPVGDFLSAGYGSNYQADLTMNHIYFTALQSGAGLAAALARGDGKERIYIVEPTGEFENDPNVTNKKFPGNPSRSYRTRHPLKILDEVRDWVKLSPEERQRWRDKLAQSKGEIIN